MKKDKSFLSSKSHIYQDNKRLLIATMSHVNTEIADAYQPLFNILHGHGIVLTISEMDEIIRESQKVVEKINEVKSKKT